MKIRHSEDYRKLRRQGYPAVGEQLDAVFKMARALRNIVEMPPEVTAWIDECQRIKDQYQKKGDL